MQALALIQRALEGQLAVYTGAGISARAHMPVGSQLSERVHARLLALGLSVDALDPSDLLQLAEFAEAEADGLEMLQKLCLEVGGFKGIVPTSEHLALALLLLEGAITLLTTNWDVGIERAPTGELISAVTTNEDAQLISGAKLYKVHGCATKPETLLISKKQMAAAPVWASAAVSALLSHATMIFLGIGDIAPYVRLRLEQLLHDLGNTTNVRVVSRNIVDSWADGKNQWRELLPDLRPEHRIQVAAATFCDELLRAWVLKGMDKSRVLATAAGPMAETAFEDLWASMASAYADDIVLWLRRSRFNAADGSSAVHSTQVGYALLALALLGIADDVDCGDPSTGVTLGTAWIELVACEGMVWGMQAAEEGHRRLAGHRAAGRLMPDQPAIIICSGTGNSPVPKVATGLVADIVADTATGDLVGGESAGTVTVMSAFEILNGASA
jgi:hypothetical protein